MTKNSTPMKASIQEKSPLWHTLPCEVVFSDLKSTPSGLAESEAVQRLAQYGPNELQASHGISLGLIFFGQFKNVLIVIFLLAMILSAFFAYEVEAIVIATTVLFVVLIGFVQEYRLKRVLKIFRQIAAPTSTVLRDGQEVEIPVRRLVPGDVVLLRAGKKVPADVRITEVVNLQIEEAALTGESISVEKLVAPLSNGELAIGDRKNMAYAGTVAIRGRGRAVVVATGMNTEFGRVARMIQSIETGKAPCKKISVALSMW